mmetsp:Transcript_90713/g.287414  ORF Transcript_90713/g.287414 Transcript_90713/m.287414 type:complete len:257 (+) Transcript_90713:1336-2106(+)
MLVARRSLPPSLAPFRAMRSSLSAWLRTLASSVLPDAFWPSKAFTISTASWLLGHSQTAQRDWPAPRPKKEARLTTRSERYCLNQVYPLAESGIFLTTAYPILPFSRRSPRRSSSRRSSSRRSRSPRRLASSSSRRSPSSRRLPAGRSAWRASPLPPSAAGACPPPVAGACVAGSGADGGCSTAGGPLGVRRASEVRGASPSTGCASGAPASSFAGCASGASASSGIEGMVAPRASVRGAQEASAEVRAQGRPCTP